jgi:hypothetical protein
MREQQKSRILSTHKAIMQHVGEIKQLAATGRTPTGQQLASLPEPLRTELLVKLEALTTCFTDMLGTLGIKQHHTKAHGEESGATLMWVSILLRTVEDLVRDMQPVKLSAQYGALEEGEAETLKTATDEALKLVHAAMQTPGKRSRH